MASFMYKPGTIIALCGKTFRHKVEGFSGFDRLCIAHFLRYPVHRRVEHPSPEADYVKAQIFLDMCSDEFREQVVGCYTNVDRA